MIVAGAMKICALVIKMLLFLLPTFTPPRGADLSAFQVIAWLVPINEIITLSTLIVTFVVASLAYMAINWVLNKVRGSG